MLESVVDDPEDRSEDDGGDHHQDRGVLELLPGRPGGLLGQLDPRLFHVVCKLTHLYF